MKTNETLHAEKDFVNYFSGEKCLAERSRGDYAQRVSDAYKEKMFEAFGVVKHNHYKHKPQDIDAANSYRVANHKTEEAKQIQSLTANTSYKLLPNPAKETVVISCTKPISQIVIFDALGNQVKTINNYEPNSNIDVSNFSSGLYVIKLNVGNSIQYQRLVISK